MTRPQRTLVYTLLFAIVGSLALLAVPRLLDTSRWSA